MARNSDEPERALVDLTRRLIDIESVSQNETEITEFIRGRLPDSAQVLHDDDSVVYVCLDDPTLPATVLAGHTDTVPLANSTFPSLLTEGAVRGRGATDMKGSLAVMLQVAHEWSQIDPAQRTRSGAGLALLFFGREELPAQFNPLPAFLNGSPAMENAELVLLMEPTANAVELGCMGNLNLTLNYTGIAGHSARPWTAENAAHKAIEELEGLGWTGPTPVEVDGYEYLEVAGITGLRSGIARNVVPDTAEVDINVRYAWSDQSPAEREQLWKARFPAAGVTIASHASAAPPLSEPGVVEALLAAGASQARPKQAWTNAADFAKVGIPVVHFGPGDPALAHTDAEQVEVAALAHSHSVLENYLRGRDVEPQRQQSSKERHK